MKFPIHLFLIIFTAILTFSCATSPSGRKQLILIPSSQINQLGATSFSQLQKETPSNKNPKQVAYVTCITNRLLVAMGQKPSEWQIGVFEDKNANAFALPGKKMGINTGMLTLAQNQDQIAAVIGHEIGHVLAQHGNERMSQNLVAQTGLQVGAVALGMDSSRDSLILGALGLGAQFGILLPFSRTHEREADRLGQKYMALAGFDPRQAPELWVLMSKGAGQSPPEFLSTHPSPTSRIADLKKRAIDYMPSYEAVTDKPKCKK